MECLLVCGTRPNFVKVAALWHAFDGRDALAPSILHTGQHYDPALDAVFFDQLGLPTPVLRLECPREATRQLPFLLEAIGRVVAGEQDDVATPDLVVVVGDVTSTLAASLAAARARTPLAHVEAGLRSFDRSMPEELNRLAVDALSDLLFASEASGVENLQREGVPTSHVALVGNVMIDTLARQGFLDATDASDASDAPDEPYAVWTSHRPGNVDSRDALAELLETLRGVCARLSVVFPVHPRARRRLEEHALWPHLAAEPRLRLMPPLGYRDFLGLLAGARVVLTDSGGVQEETTVLGVPCLTLRDNTERPSTVESGWNRLVGRRPARVLEALDEVLRDAVPGGDPPPGWDGRAAERIADVLEAEGVDGLAELQATRAGGRTHGRQAPATAS